MPLLSYISIEEPKAKVTKKSGWIILRRSRNVSVIVIMSISAVTELQKVFSIARGQSNSWISSHIKKSYVWRQFLENGSICTFKYYNLKRKYFKSIALIKNCDMSLDSCGCHFLWWPFIILESLLFIHTLYTKLESFS